MILIVSREEKLAFPNILVLLLNVEINLTRACVLNLEGGHIFFDQVWRWGGLSILSLIWDGSENFPKI